MPTYKADLHIHPTLPLRRLRHDSEYIVETALRNGIDIIGITDHNSTRHCQLTEFYSKTEIFLCCGAEVTTKEEAHCLAFFPNHERLAQFQQLLEKHLPDIPNDPDFFGDQIQIDEEMNIIYEESRLLTSALDLSIEQIEREVHALDGMFIPAHIDKSKTSVISQLGFIPFDLEYEAVEITKNTTKEAMIQQHKYLKNKPFIRSSDAHQPDQIGTNTTQLTMPTRNFEEIKKAILALAND